MNITIKKLEELHPDPANARTHSDRNIESIRASLAEFGQYKPIVVQAGTGKIIAGNGTYEAARLLGWENIDCNEIEADDMRAMAIAIADNRLGDPDIGSEWDKKRLAMVLGQMDEDLRNLTGFKEDDLQKILEKGKEEKEDPPEIVFSEEMMESQNYIVLTFDNDIDWLAAQTHFDLGSFNSKRRGGGAWQKGIGRVIKGGEYLTRIGRK